MKRRLGALVLAMLTLTACAELRSNLEGLMSGGNANAKAEPPAVGKDSSRILAKPPRRKPRPSQRNLAKPTSDPRSKTGVAKADVPRADVASIGTLDPKLLLGLDFDSTKAILGEPEVEYEQPPAKVWTYRGGSCMFSVFFFPNLNDSVFRVLTYEVAGEDQVTNSKGSNTASAKNGARKRAQRCFAELLTGQAAPNEG